MAAISYQQADPAYRKDPAHAQSHVKHILKSPAHYQAAKKRKFSPSLTMQIGSALHCLVLEGEEQFEKDFILKPDDISLTTTKGKEWKASVGSRTILSRSDQYASWDAVHGMAAALRRLDWFDPSQTDYRKYNELSLYWDQDGLSCKARIDRLVLENGQATILDLKTTDSVDPSDFRKKIIGGLNYLFQDAWYREAVIANFKVPTNFIFVGIERTPPYNVALFEATPEMIEEGLAQTAYARTKLAHCLRTRQWDPPPIKKVDLDLPPWYTSPLEANYNASGSNLDSAFEVPS